MTKYYLTQWEAVELFSKLISKYENINIDKFSENSFLSIMLYKYDSISLSKKFADDCLKPFAVDEGQTQHYPKALYDLSQEIRYEEPVVRSANRLILLLKYINEENTISLYNALGSSWKPSDRQRMFENTTWHLYYYEEYKDRETRKVQTGITRAVVQLMPFARLSIMDVDASEGEPGKNEEFKGRYSVYDGTRGQEHLFLEGRLGDTQEKDLHILIYIGTGEFDVGEIALGQYHDAAKAIYSGTIVMEKVENTTEKQAKFFKSGSEEIESVFWDYFRNKNQNRIRTKQGINRKSVLQDWINRKRD